MSDGLDVSKSVLGILKAEYGSEAKARAALQVMAQNAASDEKQRKVNMLYAQVRGMLEESDVRNCLERKQWNVEDAESELVQMVEISQAATKLYDLFASRIPRDAVVATLESVGGDVQQAAEILSSTPLGKSSTAASRSSSTASSVSATSSGKGTPKSKPSTPEVPHMREADLAKQAAVQRLVRDYPLLEVSEARNLLEQANFDPEVARCRALPISEERMVAKLRQLFPEHTDEILLRVALAVGWDLAAAAAHLDSGAPTAPASVIVANASAKLYDSVALRDLRSARLQRMAEDEKQRLHRSQVAAIERRMANVTPADFSVPSPQAVRIPPPVSEDEASLRANSSAAVSQPPAPDHSSSVSSSSANSDSAALSTTPRIVLELDPSSGRVDYGQKIMVTWRARDGYEPSNYDWIAMYSGIPSSSRMAQGEGAYVKYKYLPESSTTGTLRFTPFQYGPVYFLFMTKKSYQVLAQSSVVTVGPNFAPLEIRVDVEKRTASVRVKMLQGKADPKTWIGLYAAGEKDSRNYVSYQYVDAEVLAGSRNVEFRLPKTGSWEVRLFPSAVYSPLLTAPVVFADENKISLERSGAETRVKVRVPQFDTAVDAVWVGLFAKQAGKDEAPRRWRYLRPDDAEVSFSTPRTPGTYEARLILRGAAEPLCVSAESFEVA
jgi:hypothetical protein